MFFIYRESFIHPSRKDGPTALIFVTITSHSSFKLYLLMPFWKPLKRLSLEALIFVSFDMLKDHQKNE